MDCKRALVESGGDLEAARQSLREKGLAEAGQARRPRDAPRARSSRACDGAKGAIVAVGCETEPVSGNEEFLDFAQHVLDLVCAGGP